MWRAHIKAVPCGNMARAPGFRAPARCTIAAPMFRLTLILHAIISTILASVGVVFALVSGVSGLWPLLGSAFAGWLIAWPAAVIVARRMR